jgi:hypothetical protein
MKSVAAGLIYCGLAVLLPAGSAEQKGTKLHLTVPKQVSSDAAARAAGDAHASPPILMLEGVEISYNEGLTIKVLGPPEPGSDEPTVLAVTGMVGGQKNPNAPPQKFTLAVPLNDKASQLLEKRNEIDLTLQVEDNENRAPLKLDRAYFATKGSQ